MKSIIAIIFLILDIAPLQAEVEPFEYHVSHSFVSKYLATVGSVISEKPSFVNDLSISKGSYYAGVCNATGLDHGAYGKTYKDEFDPYVGWTYKIGPIRYEVTATYFLIADFSRSNDDLWVIDQTLQFQTILDITPYVKVRDFNRVGAKSPGGGWFLWAGVKRIQPMGKLKLEADLSAAYSDGPLGKDPGPVFYRLASSLPIPVSKSMTLTPTLCYQVPTGFQKRARSSFTQQSELVLSMSMSYSMRAKK